MSMTNKTIGVVAIYKHDVDPTTQKLVQKEVASATHFNWNNFQIETKGHNVVDIIYNGKGVLEIHFKPKKAFYARLTEAYKEFIIRLFGSIDLDAREQIVTRERYRKVLRDIQNEYGLEEGDPDMGEWMMTLVMRSPKFYEDNKGADK